MWMPPQQRIPLDQQPTARVTMGVALGLAMALLSFGVALFLGLRAERDNPVAVATVVAAFCLFGLIWLWPTWLAYSELCRRRKNVVN
jgi:O-antigen/teichoic acid export membrane protein